MRTLTSRCFLAAGLLLAGAPVWGAAETVAGNTHRLELANGEVLVGALVAEEEAVIVFRSQTWGEVRVPKAGTNLSVIAAESAEPVAQAPGWVKAQPVNAEPAAPAAAPVNAAIPAAAPEPRAKWRRSLEAGYTYQSTGNLVSTHSTYVRAEITRETKTGLAGIEGRYLYGEQNSVRNTDKAEAAFRIREKIKDRLNVRNNFSYSFDNLKDLSNQFEEVLGLSYEVFNTPKLRYAIGPGIAVQYAEPALGQDGFKYLGDVSHEFKWQIVPRVSISNISSVLFRPDQLEDHRFRSNSVLSGQVTENVSVNLRYEYEYEAIRPVASGRSDNRVFTTLGYVF